MGTKATKKRARPTQQQVRPETTQEKYDRQEAAARRMGLITDEMLRNGEVG